MLLVVLSSLVRCQRVKDGFSPILVSALLTKLNYALRLNQNLGRLDELPNRDLIIVAKTVKNEPGNF